MTEHDHNCILALSQLFPELSPTECKVAILNSILGQTTKEIAKDIGVNIETIKTHFKRAKEKLKCDTLQELRGIITLRILTYSLLRDKAVLTGIINTK